ncbi:uncharacterized protein LOC121368986 isoform X2 [Gigantopelta aegis]|uniref:uncharacterized protein LOC121368986 isoform X2 n=1 Tax=Gigantopelta aegis TaxID=1735272 RepID=UPI001B88C907|nr:uncharacterized protein LOC121368986 isoform X2 [Gigantopelta aegis]
MHWSLNKMILPVLIVCLVLGADATPFPDNSAQHPADGSQHPTTVVQHQESTPAPQQANTKGKKPSNLITIQSGHIKVALKQTTIDVLTEMFNRIDKDKDGFISSDEHSVMWNSIDTDGDDVLSTEEISTSHTTWYEAFAGDVNGDGIMSQKDAEHVIKAMDLDGDGRNGLDEFLVFIGLVKTQNEDSHNYR